MSEFEFNCPNCQQSLEAPVELAGQELTCPACQRNLRVPSPANPPPPRATASVVKQRQVEGRHVTIEVNRGASPLGIAALVLGIIGCLFAWIPFLGLLSIPISGIGLLLALMGLVMAMVSRKTGFGFPIGGGATCALSIFIAVVITGGVAKSVSDAVDESQRTAQQVVAPTGSIIESPAVSDSPPVPSPTGSTMESPAVSDSPPVPRPTAEERETPQWADASKAVLQDAVQVQIVGVRVGVVPVKDVYGGDIRSSEDRLLQVKLRITNVSARKKIDFRTWRGSDFVFGRDFASLTDDSENVYKRIGFGSSSRPAEGIMSESIYPGKALTDVLIFERPVEGVEWLHLEFPAKNFGGEGMIRFEIPGKMIDWR